MARSKPTISTRKGRRLVGACTQEQAAHFLNERKRELNAMFDCMSGAQRAHYARLPRIEQQKIETRYGVRHRDGRCTVESAEYVLRFGRRGGGGSGRLLWLLESVW